MGGSGAAAAAVAGQLADEAPVIVRQDLARTAGPRQFAGHWLTFGRQAVTGKTGQTKWKDIAAGQVSCS